MADMKLFRLVKDNVTEITVRSVRAQSTTELRRDCHLRPDSAGQVSNGAVTTFRSTKAE
jgi:hypothetical protein